jgi:hypothetical protein
MYPWWQSTAAIHDLSSYLRMVKNYSMEDLQKVWSDPEAHDDLWTEYLMSLPVAASATPELLFAE